MMCSTQLHRKKPQQYQHHPDYKVPKAPRPVTPPPAATQLILREKEDDEYTVMTSPYVVMTKGCTSGSVDTLNSPGGSRCVVRCSRNSDSRTNKRRDTVLLNSENEAG